MNFIKKLVIKWVRDDWNSASREAPVAVASKDIGLNDCELSFRIYGATGGYVMDFRRYDKRTDRYDSQLYIVPKEEDIGERVARIVNLEMLK